MFFFIFLCKYTFSPYPLQTFPDIFQGKRFRRGKIKGDLWDGRKEEGTKNGDHVTSIMNGLELDVITNCDDIHSLLFIIPLFLNGCVADFG